MSMKDTLRITVSNMQWDDLSATLNEVICDESVAFAAADKWKKKGNELILNTSVLSYIFPDDDLDLGYAIVVIKNFVFELAGKMPASKCVAKCLIGDSCDDYGSNCAALLCTYEDGVINCVSFEDCGTCYLCTGCFSVSDWFDFELSKNGQTIICPECKNEIPIDSTNTSDTNEIWIYKYELVGDEWNKVYEEPVFG